MSKYTAEPWTFHLPAKPKDREASLDCGIAGKVNGEEKIIAEAFGQVSHTRFAPAIANARRIVACVNACEGIDPAAVPALLKACKQLVRLIEGENKMIRSMLIAGYASAREAIALAEPEKEKSNGVHE